MLQKNVLPLLKIVNIFCEIYLWRDSLFAQISWDFGILRDIYSIDILLQQNCTYTIIQPVDYQGIYISTSIMYWTPIAWILDIFYFWLDVYIYMKILFWFSGPVLFPPSPPGDPSDTSGVVVGASGFGFVPPGSQGKPYGRWITLVNFIVVSTNICTNLIALPL